MVVTLADYAIDGVACPTPQAVADALSRRPLLGARHVMLDRLGPWLRDRGHDGLAADVAQAREEATDPFVRLVLVDRVLRHGGDLRWGGQPLTDEGLSPLFRQATAGDDLAVQACDLVTVDLLCAIAEQAQDSGPVTDIAERWQAAEEELARLVADIPRQVRVPMARNLPAVVRRLRWAVIDPEESDQLQTDAAAVPAVARYVPWFRALTTASTPASWVLQVTLGGTAGQLGEPIATRARQDRIGLVWRMVWTVGAVAVVSGLWIAAESAQLSAGEEQTVAVEPAPTPSPTAPPPPPAARPAAPATPTLPDDCAVAAFITRRIEGDALLDADALRRDGEISAAVVQSALVPGWSPGQFVVVAGFETSQEAQQAVADARSQGFDGVPLQGTDALCRELA